MAYEAAVFWLQGVCQNIFTVEASGFGRHSLPCWLSESLNYSHATIKLRKGVCVCELCKVVLGSKGETGVCVCVCGRKHVYETEFVSMCV